LKRRAFSRLQILIALTPFADRGVGGTRILALPFAVVIGVLNACGHLGGSLYFGRWLPGATTAPLLIAFGTWLLVSALRRNPTQLAPQRFEL